MTADQARMLYEKTLKQEQEFAQSFTGLWNARIFLCNKKYVDNGVWNTTYNIGQIHVITAASFMQIYASSAWVPWYLLGHQECIESVK